MMLQFNNNLYQEWNSDTFQKFLQFPSLFQGNQAANTNIGCILYAL